MIIFAVCVLLPQTCSTPECGYDGQWKFYGLFQVGSYDDSGVSNQADLSLFSFLSFNVAFFDFLIEILSSVTKIAICTQKFIFAWIYDLNCFLKTAFCEFVLFTIFTTTY